VAYEFMPFKIKIYSEEGRKKVAGKQLQTKKKRRKSGRESSASSRFYAYVDIFVPCVWGE
jgi:hypothetical protein